MKEIVWVVGASSAGKETFIKKVSTDRSLAKRFGWQDKVISVCEESIDYPGDINMPEILVIRKQIPSIMQKLTYSSDVVLVKWQHVDSYIESPQKLKKLLPNADHKIILLIISDKEWERRLNTKDWWHGSWKSARDLIKDETKLNNKFLDKLKYDFKITTVKSGEDDNYRITTEA